MAKVSTKPWHKVVQLRDDILNEELSQKQFAADLYDVVMDRNPGLYHDPREFFALTYPPAARALLRSRALNTLGCHGNSASPRRTRRSCSTTCAAASHSKQTAD